MADDLPPKDSPDLHLVVATPEEILAQLHHNSDEWRGPLPLDQYLEREKHLMQQDLTKDGGLTPWMLVHQPANSEKPRRVLCGCESIKKRALYAKDGQVEDVVAHGVASVFCPKEYRGHGYAGRMMDELGKRLETWQAEEASGKKSAFSVLYSDIGKSFYKAHGWQPMESSHITLPAATTATGRYPGECSALGEQNMDVLCAKGEQLIRETMHKLSSPVAESKFSATPARKSSRPAVALVPDAATLRWHHARDEFVTQKLKPDLRDALINSLGADYSKGASVSVGGGDMFCWWTRVWTSPQEETPNTLHILRLEVPDDEYFDDHSASRHIQAASALLSLAQAVARESGMKQVQIWNPTNVTIQAARNLDSSVELVHREKESIASLRWYGEESWTDDGDQPVGWICNQKYGWC